MSLKKGFLSLICAAVLVLGLAVPAALATPGEVYVLAVNDQFAKPLSASNMPIFVNYTPYIPLPVFTDYGAELGIVVSSDGGKVTLFTKQKALTYDLSAGTCVDQEGNGGYTRAVSRGGITYLPLSSIRDFFTSEVIDFTMIIADSETTLIRIVTPSALLDQETFRDSALSSLPGLLRTYRNSLASPTPTPSAGMVPTPTPTPDRNGIRVYLAFDCTGSGGLSSILDTLGRQGRSALFLFRPGDLAENDALIRRVVGLGHTLGLTIPVESGGEAAALLEEGNRQLELIAHVHTRIAYVESGDRALSEDLSAEGWTLWQSDVTAGAAADSAVVSTLLAQIDQRPDLARILLPDSSRAAAVLPQLLRELASRNYGLRPALPTELN